jgi:hypothetical protein
MVRCVRRAVRVGAWLAVLLLATSCSFVRGPITGPGDISLVTGFDLSHVGYERSEHFLAGLALAYRPTAPLTSDGELSVEADGSVPAAGFNTRMVTIRPTDPARFNGTVIVEWLNVSAGVDLPTDWIFSHTELIRSGAAYVGVSAQRVGVDALRTGTPARYGDLRHPGDSFSYGIFTEAGRQIRSHPDQVLHGLTPQRIIAAGESQSAGRMVTYIDAIHPLVPVYDGFMVHSRSAGGAPLTQAPQASVPMPSPLRIRDDLDVPVMVVQAEGDVISSNLGARQPDTPMFRSWEMAGTAHADAYTLQVGFTDEGDGSGATRMFDLMRNPPTIGCAAPVNAGPHHWILNAAYHALDNWIRTGTPPATAPLLAVASTSPTVLVRDAHGNAVGGIRTPHVDAPIARLDSINSGAGFCRLFGSTTPFTPAQLGALYPTHAEFVSAWSASLSAAVTAGFILPADQPELLTAAQNSTVPR